MLLYLGHSKWSGVSAAECHTCAAYPTHPNSKSPLFIANAERLKSACTPQSTIPICLSTRRWQRPPLTGYVGHLTLIMTLRGMTDSHISIYINVRTGSEACTISCCQTRMKKSLSHWVLRAEPPPSPKILLSRRR